MALSWTLRTRSMVRQRCVAAENGHEAALKLLLEKDSVDLDSKDTFYGRTPLWWAAANWYEAVQAAARQGGRRPDSRNKDGRTPLWWAATNGHEAVVKPLLEKGTDLKSCKRPLFRPAEYKQERDPSASKAILGWLS